MTELLEPCPFCGGEPIVERYEDNSFSVTCPNHEWHKSKESGISVAGDIAIYVSLDNGEYDYETGEIVYSEKEIERCRRAAVEAWNRRTERTCHNLGREEGTNYELYDFGCSSCGYCADITEPNYCPHCRAKVVD